MEINKIKDLLPRMSGVNIEAEVISKAPEKTFNKFGKEGRLCVVTLKDDSGKVEMVLWNESIDEVGEGDKIRITNGFVREFNNNIQLSLGREGKLEILKKGEPKKNPSDLEEVEEMDVEEETI